MWWKAGMLALLLCAMIGLVGLSERPAAAEESSKDTAEAAQDSRDQRLRDSIPVGVGPVRSSTTETKSSVPQSSSARAAYDPICKKKTYTVPYVDRQDKPILRFTVVKTWCFNGEKVLSGGMNEVQPWIREDLRYKAGTGGWRYVSEAQAGTDQFVPFEGRANGGHKSTRAGKFEFFLPGDVQPSSITKVGVIQTGRYQGTCESSQYSPQQARITSGPSGTVTSTNARFAFSTAAAGSSFACSLDGGAFGVCSSPKTYTGLKGGSHTFRVVAMDAKKNAVLKAPPRSWTVDLSAPTITSVAPAAGATGVASGSNVAVVFSEDVQAISLIGNVTLVKAGTTSPVGAALSYDPKSRRATLNPDANLSPGATYTATVRGGSSGVKDRAGTPLARTKSWSFTVAR